METFTVQAVYKKGVLKPKIKLDLPENTIVEVEVRSLIPQKKSAFGSLIGIWQHLTEAEVNEIEKNLSRVRQLSGAKVKKISYRK